MTSGITKIPWHISTLRSINRLARVPSVSHQGSIQASFIDDSVRKGMPDVSRGVGWYSRCDDSYFLALGPTRCDMDYGVHLPLTTIGGVSQALN